MKLIKGNMQINFRKYLSTFYALMVFVFLQGNLIAAGLHLRSGESIIADIKKKTDESIWIVYEGETYRIPSDEVVSIEVDKVAPALFRIYRLKDGRILKGIPVEETGEVVTLRTEKGFVNIRQHEVDTLEFAGEEISAPPIRYLDPDYSIKKRISITAGPAWMFFPGAASPVSGARVSLSYTHSLYLPGKGRPGMRFSYGYFPENNSLWNTFTITGFVEWNIYKGVLWEFTGGGELGFVSVQYSGNSKSRSFPLPHGAFNLSVVRSIDENWRAYSRVSMGLSVENSVSWIFSPEITGGIRYEY